MEEQQVCYQIPEMDKVEVQKGHLYHANGLTMDIYRPSAASVEVSLPVVIFVFGFSDTIMLDKRGRKLKDSGQYTSWARLIAASGYVAITYETHKPERDIFKLLQYIQQNAEDLQMDANKIALWACSGNVPTALSVLMQGPSESIQCAVMYYGAMLDWPGSSLVAEASAQAGFINACEQYSFDELQQNVPILLVRAGQDFPALNQTIDRFLIEAISRNLPVHFVNYPLGKHGFDISDASPQAQNIIKETVAFMTEHLCSRNEDVI